MSVASLHSDEGSYIHHSGGGGGVGSSGNYNSSSNNNIISNVNVISSNAGGSGTSGSVHGGGGTRRVDGWERLREAARGAMRRHASPGQSEAGVVEHGEHMELGGREGGLGNSSLLLSGGRGTWHHMPNGHGSLQDRVVVDISGPSSTFTGSEEYEEEERQWLSKRGLLLSRIGIMAFVALLVGSLIIVSWAVTRGYYVTSVTSLSSNIRDQVLFHVSDATISLLSEGVNITKSHAATQTVLLSSPLLLSAASQSVGFQTIPGDEGGKQVAVLSWSTLNSTIRAVEWSFFSSLPKLHSVFFHSAQGATICYASLPLNSDSSAVASNDKDVALQVPKKPGSVFSALLSAPFEVVAANSSSSNPQLLLNAQPVVDAEGQVAAASSVVSFSYPLISHCSEQTVACQTQIAWVITPTATPSAVSSSISAQDPLLSLSLPVFYQPTGDFLGSAGISLPLGSLSSYLMGLILPKKSLAYVLWVQDYTTKASPGTNSSSPLVLLASSSPDDSSLLQKALEFHSPPPSAPSSPLIPSIRNQTGNVSVTTAAAAFLRRKFSISSLVAECTHSADIRLINGSSSQYYVDSCPVLVDDLPGLNFLVVSVVPKSAVMGNVEQGMWTVIWICVGVSIFMFVIGWAFVVFITARINEQFKLKKELLRQLTAKQKAEKSSNFKSRFLANMSHELRTPTAGIIGLLDLLACDKSLSQQQSLMLQQIRRCAAGLLALVNNVLDISKVEVGGLELYCAPFNMIEEMETLLDMFAVHCIGKGIDLSMDISEDVPTMVLGDAMRFRQILTNLVSNSVKFTESGHIQIRAWVVAVASSQTQVLRMKDHFSVSISNLSGIRVAPARSRNRRSGSNSSLQNQSSLNAPAPAPLQPTSSLPANSSLLPQATLQTQASLPVAAAASHVPRSSSAMDAPITHHSSLPTTLNRSETFSPGSISLRRSGERGSKNDLRGLEGGPDEKVAIIFEVDDTGCGIPLEQREQIFESFFQVDSSSTRSHGGSGLGLYIVRGLVSLMGGTVAVADKDGPGTLIRFSVILPRVQDQTNHPTSHRLSPTFSLLNYPNSTLPPVAIQEKLGPSGSPSLLEFVDVNDSNIPQQIPPPALSPPPPPPTLAEIAAASKMQVLLAMHECPGKTLAVDWLESRQLVVRQVRAWDGILPSLDYILQTILLQTSEPKPVAARAATTGRLKKSSEMPLEPQSQRYTAGTSSLASSISHKRSFTSILENWYPGAASISGRRKASFSAVGEQQEEHELAKSNPELNEKFPHDPLEKRFPLRPLSRQGSWRFPGRDKVLAEGESLLENDELARATESEQEIGSSSGHVDMFVNQNTLQNEEQGSSGQEGKRIPVLAIIDIMLLPGSEELYSAPTDLGDLDPLAIGAFSANILPRIDSDGSGLDGSSREQSYRQRIPQELQELCQSILTLREKAAESAEKIILAWLVPPGMDPQMRAYLSLDHESFITSRPLHSTRMNHMLACALQILHDDSLSGSYSTGSEEDEDAEGEEESGAPPGFAPALMVSPPSHVAAAAAAAAAAASRSPPLLPGKARHLSLLRASSLSANAGAALGATSHGMHRSVASPSPDAYQTSLLAPSLGSVWENIVQAKADSGGDSLAAARNQNFSSFGSVVLEAQASRDFVHRPLARRNSEKMGSLTLLGGHGDIIVSPQDERHSKHLPTSTVSKTKDPSRGPLAQMMNRQTRLERSVSAIQAGAVSGLLRTGTGIGLDASMRGQLAQIEMMKRSVELQRTGSGTQFAQMRNLSIEIPEADFPGAKGLNVRQLLNRQTSLSPSNNAAGRVPLARSRSRSKSPLGPEEAATVEEKSGKKVDFSDKLQFSSVPLQVSPTSPMAEKKEGLSMGKSESERSSHSDSRSLSPSPLSSPVPSTTPGSSYADADTPSSGRRLHRSSSFSGGFSGEISDGAAEAAVAAEVAAAAEGMKSPARADTTGSTRRGLRTSQGRAAEGENTDAKRAARRTLEATKRAGSYVERSKLRSWRDKSRSKKRLQATLAPPPSRHNSSPGPRSGDAAVSRSPSRPSTPDTPPAEVSLKSASDSARLATPSKAMRESSSIGSSSGGSTRGGGGAGGGDVEAAEKGAPLSGFNILVVEDTAILQKLATSMLKKLGAKVAVVSDGQQAVEAVMNTWRADDAARGGGGGGEAWTPVGSSIGARQGELETAQGAGEREGEEGNAGDAEVESTRGSGWSSLFSRRAIPDRGDGRTSSVGRRSSLEASEPLEGTGFGVRTTRRSPLSGVEVKGGDTKVPSDASERWRFAAEVGSTTPGAASASSTPSSLGTPTFGSSSGTAVGITRSRSSSSPLNPSLAFPSSSSTDSTAAKEGATGAGGSEGPALYDVVLMDCQMPVMDGYTATQTIRAAEAKNGRHTIICALTAHALASDEAKCRQSGMDGYLTKPINLRLLVETIYKLTSQKRDGLLRSGRSERTTSERPQSGKRS